MQSIQLSSLSWANPLFIVHKQVKGLVKARGVGVGACIYSWRSVKDRERYIAPTSQEAMGSRLCLIKEHINIPYCSSSPSHLPKDIPECHCSSSES